MDSVFRHGKNSYDDFSYDLRDRTDWKVATIREAEILGHITAMAIEPVNGFVAIGTKNGRIFIFGALAVSTLLRLPKPTAVRFLHFMPLVFRLICIDDYGTLHVVDLTELGGPKFVAAEPFKDSVRCIANSPSHSHIFIASPYIIPNVWRSHEQVSVSTRMQLAPPVTRSSLLVDMLIHPRDLNLLFLVFTGGVSLFDIAERKSLHHYELLVPPGAPGGVGYHDPDLLKTRSPQATCIAIHPSGHMFAVGHADGCISFWAVEDEDKPLMVRTTDSLDVHYPDGEKLDEALTSTVNSNSNGQIREPVYKLAWCGFGSSSDPYGQTVLSVLGGSHTVDSPGVICFLLPSCSLPSTSVQTEKTIHPEILKALILSLRDTDNFLYATFGPAQDFLLVPKDNPHFSGTFNPKVILLLSEDVDGSRTINAKEFPPPSFGLTQSGSTTSSSDKELDNSLDKELAETLQSLQSTREPASMSLPLTIWSGTDGICDGDIIRVEDSEYETLINSKGARVPSVGRGGSAWVNYADADQATALQWTKYQPHRFLVTHHRDLSVRFQDISPQLLTGSPSSPLTSSFPAPLDFLTISLSELLYDTALTDAERPVNPEDTEIQSVQLTSETNECAIVLRSGHVLVYGFSDEARRASHLASRHDEILSLTTIAASEGTFQPILLVDNKWGSVAACEMSNIGFLAIAYANGVLIVVDLRQPSVVFREVPDEKRRKRHSISILNSSDGRKVQSLRWFVCGLGDDTIYRVRLFVAQRSGDTRVFTFGKGTSRTWSTKDPAVQIDGPELPLPKGMFVLNGKTGASRLATKGSLVEAINGVSAVGPRMQESRTKEAAHCFWVSAGRKGVRCVANIVGSKVGRAEWPKGHEVECVEVINRSGAQALIAVMDTREAFVYSLPSLEILHTFQLGSRPNSAISLDDTGDYIDWTFDEKTMTVNRMTLGTFFAIRRVYDEPIVDYTVNRRAVPSPPQPVPLGPVTMFNSFFNFKRGLSGDQIDALLAGPNRPIPQDTSAVMDGRWQSQFQSRASEIAKQGSKLGSDLYNNLTSTVSERGDMLNGLEDRFRSLGDGGKRMVTEAKKLAAEQTAKGWLRSWTNTG